MKYSIDTLVELVKINMEESQDGYGTLPLPEIDSVGIDHYIKEKIPEAVVKVFAAAPSYLLEQTDMREQLVPKPYQDGSGEVVLPDDMLKMTLFRMHGWKRPVTDFLHDTHPVAELQNNIYSRGGAAKPVAVITHNGEGNRVLRYYSLPPETRIHKIEEALYVKLPDLSHPGEINEVLLPSVTYLAAAMVYEITGEAARAAIMNQRVVVG